MGRAKDWNSDENNLSSQLPQSEERKYMPKVLKTKFKKSSIIMKHY